MQTFLARTRHRSRCSGRRLQPGSRGNGRDRYYGGPCATSARADARGVRPADDALDHGPARDARAGCGAARDERRDRRRSEYAREAWARAARPLRRRPPSRHLRTHRLRARSRDPGPEGLARARGRGDQRPYRRRAAHCLRASAARWLPAPARYAATETATSSR